MVPFGKPFFVCDVWLLLLGHIGVATPTDLILENFADNVSLHRTPRSGGVQLRVEEERERPGAAHLKVFAVVALCLEMKVARAQLFVSMKWI